ncbi:uncharacterized protein LOC109715401, partial [Ananas comosus]|uniref:Uncharacterized protein LOC109715401 n=1 Tax=Ananas comosus TaxID=4615 RepID=A0A6P5FR50_ANACO
MANDDDALSSSRPWSQLPAEILAQVLHRINPNEEFTRFASVCMAWGAVAAKEPLSLPHQMPWLLLTEEDYPGEREGCDARSFYSLSEDKIHELDLPEACRRRCVGSTDGWLVTVGEAFEGEEMHVLNPVMRTRLPLPPQSTLVLPVEEYEFPVRLRARGYLGGEGSEEEVEALAALLAEEEAAEQDAGEVAEMGPQGDLILQ